MGYRVISVPLDIASAEKVQIVDISNIIDEVAILDMPAGVQIGLCFGDGPPIPISAPVTFQPSGIDEQGRGLYIVNTVAHIGASINIIVASGGSVRARI